jgi:hypothetical protein
MIHQRCSAFLPSKGRIRTESLAAAVSVSGKRDFTRRDKGAEIAAGHPCASPLIQAYSPRAGKSPFELDCVVGPGGVSLPSVANNLGWQTDLSARFGAKCIFRTLANRRETATPANVSAS